MADLDERKAWCIAAALFAAVIMLWIIASYFEAAAFNRLTGSSATVWDAMWTELRVQGAPK